MAKYLKLPYLGNNSEKISKKTSEEVNQVFGSVRLTTILYNDRPLTGIYKDVSPTIEKSNIIYKLSCHCGSDYMGKTSQRFNVKISQHVPKILKIWYDGRPENLQKNISQRSDSI